MINGDKLLKNMRAWAEVNLDAIAHNVTEIKRKLKPGVKLMGVVKADAYGHGAFQVAQVLLEQGAEYLAVAFADEAVELRRKGITVPILILGNSAEANIDCIVDFDITAAVSECSFAEKLSAEALARGKKAKVHIKIDTGMSRIGFPSASEDDISETCGEIRRVVDLPGIEVEGLFSHFASADEEDEAYTRMQFDRFRKVVSELERLGADIPLKHICNSAGAVKFPEMQMDMVRGGIIVYGMYPSREFDRGMIKLVPSMTFKARVIQVKEVDKETSVSYGMTFKSEEKMKIATVSVGYADGYPRNLSNRAEVFVYGERIGQIGRICMDQCMIDASKVNNINIGDEVILFGDADGKGISVDWIAELLETINYEITCGVSRRVPRVYIKDGRIIGSHNYILDGNDL